jgi:hypothetical protein
MKSIVGDNLHPRVSEYAADPRCRRRARRERRRAVHSRPRRGYLLHRHDCNPPISASVSNVPCVIVGVRASRRFGDRERRATLVRVDQKSPICATSIHVGHHLGRY